MGAGAIGCELLKGFALVGLGTSSSGGVTVADMDHVERSNLSRQFLFRPQDIGVRCLPFPTPHLLNCTPSMTSAPLLASQRPKAEVAAEAAHRLNSDMQVTPLSYPVDHTTEHIYGDDFFSHVDGVVAALDSFQARECSTWELSLLPKAVPAPLLILCPLVRAICGYSLRPLSEANAGSRHTGHPGQCFSVYTACD